MSLTPEQIEAGWRPHDGSAVSPIKDDRTLHQIMESTGWISMAEKGRKAWAWRPVIAYRIIEAHGADAEPARPTPWPRDYSELVFDSSGWSQTIIVDGKRPEWLRDDDCLSDRVPPSDWPSRMFNRELAIRVRRREPKRETVGCKVISAHFPMTRATIDLIDGEPDLSSLKIGGDA